MRLFAALLFCFASLSAQAANPVVEVKTSEGSIVLELYPDKAPKTVENFLAYVKSGHYKGTVFHRVINGFMIQGGGFDPQLQQKRTGAPIPNEATNGLRNQPMTVAMARTNDPHSATAQFFINLENNEFLNHTAPMGRGWGYAVFGKVTKGEDVVRRIGLTPTESRAPLGSDVPRKAILIEDVRLLSAQ